MTSKRLVTRTIIEDLVIVNDYWRLSEVNDD